MKTNRRIKSKECDCGFFMIWTIRNPEYDWFCPKCGGTHSGKSGEEKNDTYVNEKDYMKMRKVWIKRKGKPLNED